MLRFTLYKTKLEISPLFFAVITLFLLADRNKIALPVIAFSLAHEAGHFAVLLLQRNAPKKLRCSAIGIQMELPVNMSTGEKSAVLCAGFVTNFCLSALFFAAGNFIFALINFVIGIFTALPLSSTDGGSIVKEIFMLGRYPIGAEKKFFICSCAVFSVFLIVAAATTKNYYLLAALVYLIACTVKT